MDAAIYKPERMMTDPGMPAPVDADGVALAIVNSPDAPPELQLARRKLSIVKVPIPADISLHEVADRFIAGVDDESQIPEDEATARPWWAPSTPEEVDRIVAAIDMEANFLGDRIAIMQQHLTALTVRRAKVINANADLIAVAAPVPEGKSFKNWTGPWSRGTYRNQVDREPIINVINKALAKAAGFFFERPKIEVVQDTQAIRAADPAELKEAGIELIPQMPVSYSPFKGGESK